MEFEELLLKRQACRKFNGKKIEDRIIDKIVDSGLMSPSACNSQPWKLYVVKEEDKVQEVAKCLQDGGRNSFTSNATCFIAVAEKTSPLMADISARLTDDYFTKYDIGEITAYLTLSAKNLGVDSCIIGWINYGNLRKVLSMPEEESCNIVIALGYSDIDTRKKIRKPKSETVVEL